MKYISVWLLVLICFISYRLFALWEDKPFVDEIYIFLD